MVVFPEMTLTGYPIEDLALRRTFRQAAWDKANELATQLNDDGLGDLFVVVGTVGTDRKTSSRATDWWSCTKAWSGLATTSTSCPTTACSTNSASSPPATAP